MFRCVLMNTFVPGEERGLGVAPAYQEVGGGGGRWINVGEFSVNYKPQGR